MPLWEIHIIFYSKSSDYLYRTVWSRYRNVVVGGHVFEMGNRWGKGKGDGEEGEGVSIQPTRDQSGRESHHDAKEGFQVSEKGSRNRGRDFQANGGYQKDWAMHLRYHANLVHIVLIVCMSG